MSTCPHLKANLFTCFATCRLFHDILLSCFVDFKTSQSVHKMFGASCSLLFVYMLTCKHSENTCAHVGIWSRLVTFKTYQVSFTKHMLYVLGLIGSWQPYPYFFLIHWINSNETFRFSSAHVILHLLLYIFLSDLYLVFLIAKYLRVDID